MARFYIDISDHTGLVRDETGLEFPDIEAARQDAVEALCAIA
jgi:hypothetical protein